MSLALAFPSDARDLQGAHANNSGSLFKGAIQGILEAKGYEAIAYRDWQQGSPTLHEQRRVVLMDVPYESIYGTGGRIGLVIRRPGQRDIYIESQRQVVAGSVDEKLPYIVENARKRLPTADTIFLYSGQGWRPGAIAWIRRQAEATPGFYVMTPDAFISWANKHL